MGTTTADPDGLYPGADHRASQSQFWTTSVMTKQASSSPRRPISVSAAPERTSAALADA
jgi:hypothetical protein